MIVIQKLFALLFAVFKQRFNDRNIKHYSIIMFVYNMEFFFIILIIKTIGFHDHFILFP